jgi:hypothetical protein
MIRMESDGDFDMVKELMAETRRDGEVAVKAAVVHLEAQTKITLTGDRAGRVYRVPGTQVDYVASAPGEAPASVTGTLRTAVQHTEPVSSQTEISADVGVDLSRVPYARRLEFGGFHTAPNGTMVRVAPRPYLRSTFTREQFRVDRILQGLLP